MPEQNYKYNWNALSLSDIQKSFDVTIAEQYSFYPANDGKSYIIPYMDPVTGNPMPDATGTPYSRRKVLSGKNKYLSNKDSGIRCYLPKKAHEFFMENPRIPLLITEGEKKAIAGTEKGLYTIGLGGITMWRSKNGSNKIHPDLIRYFQGRKEVYLLYDSDGYNSNHFKRNAEHFSLSLHEHGIKLYIAYLPQFYREKMGLDDFLQKYSVKETVQYIEWSKIYIKPKYQTGTYGRVYFDDLQEYNLHAEEYLLLSMTYSLTKKQEYCTITREALGERLNRSRQTIIKRLKKLEKKGLIVIKNVSKREKPFKLSKKGVKLISKRGLICV